MMIPNFKFQIPERPQQTDAVYQEFGIWNLPFDPATGGTQGPEPVEGESGIKEA